jgi:arylsulfatase A-like enzyme
MGADDGRPLFLVVHTYRVHGPMRIGAEEDPEPARASHAAFQRGLEERRARGEEVDERKLMLEFVSTEGKRYYEDAVADLDRKLGAWLEELERGGFFERANLILTADHGQSRGEHGQIGHGGVLYDVELRVPLAIAGRGITPRAVSGPTSLIDVAPTFAALARANPSSTWMGRSLLERDPTGPIFAFDLVKTGEHVAVYSGKRKVMGRGVQKLEEGHPTLAFDLEHDPEENDDLAKDEGWPAELGRSLAGTLDPMLVPLGTGGAAQLSEESLEELRELGYGR